MFLPTRPHDRLQGRGLHRRPARRPSSSISTVPWLIKPLYGLLSDFFPIFGRVGVSYLFLISSLAAAGAPVAVSPCRRAPYGTLLVLFTRSGSGLAFTDVLDRRGHGGERQAARADRRLPVGAVGARSDVSSMLVGRRRRIAGRAPRLAAAFLVAACFPADLAADGRGVGAGAARPPEPRGPRRDAWTALRQALGRARALAGGRLHLLLGLQPVLRARASSTTRPTPSHFSQTLIGALASLGAAASIAGAWVYARLARRFPLKRLIVWSIGAGLRRLPRLPRLRGRGLRGGHHGDLRRGRHDHPARLPRPGREGLPRARGGDLLRAPDVDLQPRHAQLGVDRGQPLRLARLHAPGADLDRLHRGRRGCSCRWCPSTPSRPPRPPPRPRPRRPPEAGPGQLSPRSSRSTAPRAHS